MQRGSVESLVDVGEVYGRLRAAVRRVILSKGEIVELCLVSLFAGGHVLLTVIPGVGKTTLARAVGGDRAGRWETGDLRGP